MNVIDVGNGTPIVLIPGVQGRWEWMRPALEALADDYRVITFSLADEPSCGGRFDETRGFDCYVEQVGDAMDAVGVRKAAICGVSYAGLIASAFAARHPDRVSALVLVSAIPPSWAPDARVRFYLRSPRLMTPLFMLASLRMFREIAAAVPGFASAARVALGHAATALWHPFSPVRMARRVRLLSSVSLREGLARLRVPTLVVTGEPALDRVVPVSRTHEYLQMWPHARQSVIAHTGHIGLVTRPKEFARVVGTFVDSVGPAEAGLHGQGGGPDIRAEGRHARSVRLQAHQEKRVG